MARHITLGHNASMRWRHLLLVSFILSLAPSLRADTLRVAVAANFLPALQALAPSAPMTLELVPGASGMLFAQISQGAPFDVFLSADETRPQQLVAAGLALPDSVTRYSRGQLVLWRPDPGLPEASAALLERPDLRLAIANPTIAPYGAAATEVLNRVPEAKQPQRVTGNSVGQAFHFALSGNSDLALVAESQVEALPPSQRGSHWRIPADHYAPLFQSGVVLAHSASPDQALAFLHWLVQPAQQQRLQAMGYLSLTAEAP